jgi:RNA polymerase sigma-70 factor (ECF subfamily)
MHRRGSRAVIDDAVLSTLLSRVALQDRKALNDLYRLASGRLMAVAYRLLGDRAAAEDVVQETFVTVWTRAGQFPALRTSPLAWLTALARNRAIDVRRRRRPETPLQWQDADGNEHQHDAVDESGSVLDLISARQVEHQLGECLGHLEPDPRRAIALAYHEGLTHEELAQRMGRPLGTVKAWIRRSLQRLKDCIGEPA